MGTFDFVVILAGLCGFLMVLGGLLLFYKGIITLAQVSDKPDAVTFEFQKVLKIQSRYPAYGFFFFGLAFMALAAFYGRPDPQPTITLSGSVEGVVDPQATRVVVLLPLWDTSLNVDGKVQRDLHPDLKQVHIEIRSPGNDPPLYSTDVETTEKGRERIARFDPVKLKKVGEQPPSGTIEAVPAGIKLPPPDGATGFRATP
ncbi:MAG: hypothetical protein ACREYD_06860 [Casimicrobiaceae bacterium]